MKLKELALAHWIAQKSDLSAKTSDLINRIRKLHCFAGEEGFYCKVKNINILKKKCTERMKILDI